MEVSIAAKAFTEHKDNRIKINGLKFKILNFSVFEQISDKRNNLFVTEFSFVNNLFCIGYEFG